MASKKAPSRKEQELERERSILRAALTELALFDYGGLTVEDVARRAGVNKTTVYRKWPTKSELVRAALINAIDGMCIEVSFADLRSALEDIAWKVVEFLGSSEGKSLLRLRMLQHMEPELAEIAKQLRAVKAQEFMAIAQRAIAQGELAEGTDLQLLLDILWGVLMTKIVFNLEPVGPREIKAILDLLTGSAAQPAGPARATKSRGRRKPP